MRLTLAPTRSTGRMTFKIIFLHKYRVNSSSDCRVVAVEADFSCSSLYSIPMDSYSSSIEQQTSLDRPELPGSMEPTSMARSQSAPMLDDELGFPGHGAGNQNQLGQNHKPAIPQKAYHFDQNYNPQVSSPRLS